MRFYVRVVLLSLIASSAFALPPSGFANLTLNYGPPVAATPVLRDYLLISLGLLLGVIAWRQIRRTGIGRPLASLIVTVGLMAVGSMTGLVGRLDGEIVSFDLTAPTGGTLLQLIFPNFNIGIFNRSGVTVRINSMTLIDSGDGTTMYTPLTGAGFCAVGTTLAPDQSCFVKFVTF